VIVFFSAPTCVCMCVYVCVCLWHIRTCTHAYAVESQPYPTRGHGPRSAPVLCTGYVLEALGMGYFNMYRRFDHSNAILTLTKRSPHNPLFIFLVCVRVQSACSERACSECTCFECACSQHASSQRALSVRAVFTPAERTKHQPAERTKRPSVPTPALNKRSVPCLVLTNVNKGFALSVWRQQPSVEYV
jgi:hypothetical protein